MHIESHAAETGRIRFRRVRFQTPSSVSFLGLTEFQGANAVSSSQPIICVPKRTHRVFFSQNSPSLPRNSVSSLLRNSTLETVLRPFPILEAFLEGSLIGILLLGGERGGGEPGICDCRMPLSTGQTNTVPPKRCDIPCLAQGRPRLCNICMTVRCRSPDGQRHRTVM